MRFRLGTWVAVGCVLSAPALAQAQAQRPQQRQQQQQQRQQQQQQQQQQQPQQLQATFGIPVPTDAQGFAARLHQINQHEIQLGQLAMKKTQSPVVRQYAQGLVQQHQALDQRLTQFAQAQNLKLTEPKPINALDRQLMQAQQTEVQILQNLEGEAFDRYFANAMVGDHDYGLTLAMAGLQTVQEPQMQQLLQQTVPVLQQHRQGAYQLLGMLAPRPMQGVGGAGMQGVPMRPIQPGAFPQHK